jgi:hypothetical protein
MLTENMTKLFKEIRDRDAEGQEDFDILDGASNARDASGARERDLEATSGSDEVQPLQPRRLISAAFSHDEDEVSATQELRSENDDEDNDSPSVETARPSPPGRDAQVKVPHFYMLPKHCISR